MSANNDLGIQMDQLRAYADTLRGALEAAKAAAVKAQADLQTRMQEHQREVNAIRQEARNGAAQLQRTLTDAAQQEVSVLKIQMEALQAKVASKTQALEQGLASEQQIREQHDLAAAAVAEFEQQLADERSERLRLQTMLQDSNSRLKVHFVEQQRQHDEYERELQVMNAAANDENHSPDVLFCFYCASDYGGAAQD